MSFGPPRPTTATATKRPTARATARATKPSTKNTGTNPNGCEHDVCPITYMSSHELFKADQLFTVCNDPNIYNRDALVEWSFYTDSTDPRPTWPHNRVPISKPTLQRLYHAYVAAHPEKKKDIDTAINERRWNLHENGVGLLMPNSNTRSNTGNARSNTNSATNSNTRSNTGNARRTDYQPASITSVDDDWYTLEERQQVQRLDVVTRYADLGRIRDYTVMGDNVLKNVHVFVKNFLEHPEAVADDESIENDAWESGSMEIVLIKEFAIVLSFHDPVPTVVMKVLAINTEFNIMNTEYVVVIQGRHYPMIKSLSVTELVGDRDQPNLGPDAEDDDMTGPLDVVGTYARILDEPIVTHDLLIILEGRAGGRGRKHKYKGRSYKVRTGSRGGSYILVQGKKMYVR